ncbi:hypothetical protein niasHS_004188 [Heterodera schachtii]|uniref:Uncharacterized protein n=1 Tax=Heterodera schachtii TaxID=97005 RepID=A0ABD2K1Z0_HETSC
MDNTHNNNNMSSKQIPSEGEQPIGVHLSVASTTTCPLWDCGQQRPAPYGIVVNNDLPLMGLWSTTTCPLWDCGQQRPAPYGIVVNNDLPLMGLWSTTTCPLWDCGQQRPAPYGIVVNKDLPLMGLWSTTTCPLWDCGEQYWIDAFKASKGEEEKERRAPATGGAICQSRSLTYPKLPSSGWEWGGIAPGFKHPKIECFEIEHAGFFNWK